MLRFDREFLPGDAQALRDDRPEGGDRGHVPLRAGGTLAVFSTPLARAGAGLDQHHPAQGLHEHLRSRRPHRRRGLGG